jgi:death-on-curing protein
MKKLKSEQVYILHNMMLDVTNGLNGIRGIGELGLAVDSAFFDNDTYPTIIDKAACLGHDIISVQPFKDIYANKCVGLLAMLVLLEINDIFLTYTNEELVEIGLKMALGKASFGEDVLFSGKPSYKVLREWILKHQTI